MKEANTFLFPGADDHLWMIISNPEIDAEHVVIVCFLSWQSQYDQACIVEAGEHSFITHSTIVNYAGAKIVADSKLESLKSTGRLKLKEDLSPQLLTRVRKAIRESRIPLGCEKALEDQGLLD